MTNDARARALKALAQVRPFRPFHIELHSGDRFLVSHPEAVRRYGDVFLYRGPDGSQRLFDGAGISQLIEGPQPAPG